LQNDPAVVDLNDKGKHLRLDFTVEDQALSTPWSATVIYRP
jgi:hypothetical protein